MKFFENNANYNHSFPVVTLAYFLRYPNPYSTHVLSTDVIDRYVDPVTHRLHTLRLHLKRSKVPAAMLKLLPSGLAGPGGASQSYVLEKTVVDVREGWMETESRNMEWRGILAVTERQTYRRQLPTDEKPREKWFSKISETSDDVKKEWTSCQTKVSFKSRIGQALKKHTGTVEETKPKQGFFASWSTSGIQRTIELIGVKRTKTAIMNGRNGMDVVLERLRNGGIGGVLDGISKDRLKIGGPSAGDGRTVWVNEKYQGLPDYNPADSSVPCRD